MEEPRGKLACKPGSVVDSHSSRRTVTRSLVQPTRKPCGPHERFPIWSCSGWGLTCHTRYRVRGALLPHLFTLANPACRISAVCFLCHFPWPHGLRPLTGILPYGARTFLSAMNAQRLSSQLLSDCIRREPANATTESRQPAGEPADRMARRGRVLALSMVTGPG